tara:strand:+ start:125 stop:838 length:714 start_codon:yes stop_codon:yes gene_type:complete
MAIIYATTGRTGAAGANTNLWDAVHDATGGKNHTFGDAVDSAAVRSRAFNSGTAVGLFRLFMEFDTSSISSAPDTATLNIKGYGSDTTTNPPIIVLLAEPQSYNGATLNDFPGHGSGWDNNSTNITPLSAEHNSAWSTSAYNTITLNSQARDIIANEDVLPVVIMTYDYDYQDVDPTTVSNTEDVCVGVVLNESGTSQDPYLETTSGYGKDVMGIDSGNISTVNGIAVANVSKVIGV